jgi:glycosyltransferase involved in cell wall biosynthesis
LFIDSRVHLIKIENLERHSFFNFISIIKAIQELRNIEQEICPDIIHLHSSIAGGIGRIAFKGKKNAVVYTPHGYAHILMGNSVKSNLYRFIESILGKKRHVTLTCCSGENEIAKKLCKKTNYIETGINIADLTSSLDDIDPINNEKFTIYTLGRACVQKQPQVFNQIAELVPEAKFIWIGNGDLENLLTAPNVEVTGWKPRKEALAIAKGADAFILCSLGEAIAMSLIENMFLKKVSLVSNVMGNNSVICDSKNGFVCNTAEEYANRIRMAMKSFPDHLVENAYKDVLNKYNTGIMKTKYIQFYYSLIN